MVLILTEISYFIIVRCVYMYIEEECKTEHANKNGWNFDRNRGTVRLSPPWNETLRSNPFGGENA